MTFFRAFLMTRVKTYIAQEMKSSAINIFEIDENLEAFSDALKARLLDDFADYGVTLNRFFVTTIVKPDGEVQYEKFKELHFRQYANIAEAQALAQKRATEGYTYQQERGFEVAETAAANEDAGQMSNLGIELGMMASVGGTVWNVVGGAVSDAFAGVNTQPTAQQASFCENCGAKLSPEVAFCEECGTPVPKDETKCANCGYSFERPGKFCPKCGAKREG